MVDFETEGIKKFNFPDAFVRGFLQPEDDSILEQVKRNDQIEKELSVLRELEKQLERKLSSIDIKSQKICMPS